jgi:glutamate dehydrogenase (NAD(P)+)
MTWKWAAVDLFFGGAKAGIAWNPKVAGKDNVLRAFVRALSNEVPREYVLGLDMGLTESDAAVVQDELGDRGAAVGTPYELGGVPYDKLGVTGYGIAEACDAAAASLDIQMVGARVALQGFGAVGAAAAHRLDQLGASIVAISTQEGAVQDPNGLDVTSLLKLRDEVGDDLVNLYSGGKRLEAGEELFVPADILVPAAQQDVIGDVESNRVQASLVVEGANLPTSENAQRVLARRGITVIPDFVANAGGAIAAAFAMNMRYSPFPISAEPIFELISTKQRENTTLILQEAASRSVTPHVAARGLAQERVRAAMELKGQVPCGSSIATTSRSD